MAIAYVINMLFAPRFFPAVCEACAITVLCACEGGGSLHSHGLICCVHAIVGSRERHGHVQWHCVVPRAATAGVGKMAPLDAPTQQGFDYFIGCDNPWPGCILPRPSSSPGGSSA